MVIPCLLPINTVRIQKAKIMRTKGIKSTIVQFVAEDTALARKDVNDSYLFRRHAAIECLAYSEIGGVSRKLVC